MAAITSAATGNWSATTTWTGGVVPVLGDSVTINTGHVVTINGTFSCGDDTTSGLRIFGTLKASRTVSSQLTVRGRVFLTSAGTFDYGTEADPIPASVTAVVLLNDSATMANNKYSFECDVATNWSGFRMWGAPKTSNTTLSTTATSTDTVLNVVDATGWQVGDILVFDGNAVENSINSHKPRSITAISGNQITLNQNLGFASQLGRRIINLTRNVRLKPVNANFRTFLAIQTSGSQVANVIEIGNAEFQLTGLSNTNSGLGGGVNVYVALNTATTAVVKKFQDCAFHPIFSIIGTTITVIAGSTLLNLFGNQAYVYEVVRPVMTTLGNLSAIGFWSGTSTVVRDPVIIRTNVLLTMGFSQGPVNAKVIGGYVSLLNSMTTGTGSKCSIENMTIDGVTTYAQMGTMADFKLISCNINQTFGNFGSTNMLVQQVGTFLNMTVENCYITDSFFNVNTASTNLSTANEEFLLRFKNVNNDPENQKAYVRGGFVRRDNDISSRSTSSLAIDSYVSTVATKYNQTVPVAAGQTIRVIGYCRYNTAYGTVYPATLTVSGLGITPQVFTCPTSASDTWYPIDLTVTNPQLYPGNFTLSFSARSAANTQSATAYFDGILVSDFVTLKRHYGYEFDSNAYSTVNNIIQQTNESTVGGYTGININHATQKITLTSNHTVRELYDYCYYNLCQTSNLEYAEFFTSSDGQNFTCSYNIDIDNCILSGSGAISMPADVLTFIGTASTSLIITDSSGVKVNINVVGLTANSRIQLYNVSTSTELFNDIVTGTSLSFPITWTTNQTIRYRIMHVDGVTAKKWIEANATLTSLGTTITVAQQDDSIYNSIGIDGSTVSECSIVGTALIININDADNKTTAQRLLAFEIYWLYTEDGIRDQNLYIEYPDATHLIFLGGLKIKNNKPTPALSITGASIVPESGDPADVIDNSGGSVNINTDRVVYGAPIPTSSQNAEAVRTELAVELARVDVAISTRASQTTADGIKTNTDLVPALV